MDPRNCQSHGHHLAPDDLSCSLSTEGWAFFLKQRVFGNLLLDTDVFTVIFPNCRKHGVETHSDCGVSMNTSILPQPLFLKILCPFELLSGWFRFTMRRTGCGVRLPGLLSLLPRFWCPQKGSGLSSTGRYGPYIPVSANRLLWVVARELRGLLYGGLSGACSPQLP